MSSEYFSQFYILPGVTSHSHFLKHSLKCQLITHEKENFNISRLLRGINDSFLFPVIFRK
jgi:hypothetical protein